MALADHQLERLSTALDALNRSEIATSLNVTMETVQAAINDSNRLLDICVEMGMPIGEVDLNGWAAQRVTAWMVSA